MKKLLLSTVFSLSLLASAPALMAAEASASNVIAVVNTQQIMHDSTAAQNVREQLEGKQKAFLTEMTKKEEELQKEDQELGKKRSVLSKAAFDEKSQKFRVKVTEVQKERLAKKAILENASERAAGEIQKAVTDVISSMSKEKGFVIVIPTFQTLYADSKLDITSEVLSKLNQKLPKLDVKFDAAPPADKK